MTIVDDRSTLGEPRKLPDRIWIAKDRRGGPPLYFTGMVSYMGTESPNQDYIHGSVHAQACRDLDEIEAAYNALKDTVRGLEERAAKAEGALIAAGLATDTGKIAVTWEVELPPRAHYSDEEIQGMRNEIGVARAAAHAAVGRTEQP